MGRGREGYNPGRSTSTEQEFQDSRQEKKKSIKEIMQRNLKPKDKFPEVRGPPNKHGKRRACARTHTHMHTHTEAH